VLSAEISAVYLAWLSRSRDGPVPKAPVWHFETAGVPPQVGGGFECEWYWGGIASLVGKLAVFEKSSVNTNFNNGFRFSG
jgi:hypothetical protein